MWDEAQRDRRARAWFVVNAPAALPILDRDLMKLTREELGIYTEAYGRYMAAVSTGARMLRDIELVLGDQTPSAFWRDGSVVAEAWSAGGRDPAELARRLGEIDELIPFDGSDSAVGGYLRRHGLPEAAIAQLLSTWPRPVA
jgi:hypothetical protein